MVTGDNDNDVNGNGTTGNKVDDDGDGTTGNKVDDDGDGATGDDNDDNDDGDNDGAMCSGAMGYDDDDDGDGRRRRRRRRWCDEDADADNDGEGASDATTRGRMAGGTRRRVGIKHDGINLSKIISNLAEVRFF